MKFTKMHYSGSISIGEIDIDINEVIAVEQRYANTLLYLKNGRECLVRGVYKTLHDLRFR